MTMMIKLHTVHERPPQRVQPVAGRNEKVSLTTTLIRQTAYQSARTVAVNGGRGCPIAASGPVFACYRSDRALRLRGKSELCRHEVT
jgi:hypothetical protein